MSLGMHHTPHDGIQSLDDGVLVVSLGPGTWINEPVGLGPRSADSMCDQGSPCCDMFPTTIACTVHASSHDR